EVRVLDLPDGQVRHRGQPSGDVVPDDAPQEYEMPGEVVRLYLGRSPEMHGCRWVLRAYVSVQLHERVKVGVPLQDRVIRIVRFSEWLDLVFRKLRADEIYPAGVGKVPG